MIRNIGAKSRAEHGRLISQSAPNRFTNSGRLATPRERLALMPTRRFTNVPVRSNRWSSLCRADADSKYHPRHTVRPVVSGARLRRITSIVSRHTRASAVRELMRCRNGSSSSPHNLSALVTGLPGSRFKAEAALATDTPECFSKSAAQYRSVFFFMGQNYFAANGSGVAQPHPSPPTPSRKFRFRRPAAGASLDNARCRAGSPHPAFPWRAGLPTGRILSSRGPPADRGDPAIQP